MTEVLNGIKYDIILNMSKPDFATTATTTDTSPSPPPSPPPSLASASTLTQINRRHIKIKPYRNKKNEQVYTVLNYENEQEPAAAATGVEDSPAVFATIVPPPIYKFTSDDDRIYRSIILNEPGNKVLCFSPPKSIPIAQFRELFPTLQRSEFLVNDIIEGTMISLFYDTSSATGPRWEIATKSAVGGNYAFFKTNFNLIFNNNHHQQAGYGAPRREVTFRDMFNEAFLLDFVLPQCNQWPRPSGAEAVEQLLNEIFDPDSNTYSFDISDHGEQCITLPKECTFTFVLQHPMNHIVQDIRMPKLYLIDVYHTAMEPSSSSSSSSSSTTTSVFVIPPVVFIPWFDESLIYIPQELSGYDTVAHGGGTSGTTTTINGYDALQSTLDSMRAREVKHPGFMITHRSSGLRAAMTNGFYDQMIDLRGNHANIKMYYFQMRCGSKVEMFLHYFPQYHSLFEMFYAQFQQSIDNVTKHYITYFIVHDKTKARIPKCYMKMVHEIHHEVYVPSVRRKNPQKINRNVVEHFMNHRMPPNRLVRFLNYEASFCCAGPGGEEN